MADAEVVGHIRGGGEVERRRVRSPTAELVPSLPRPGAGDGASSAHRLNHPHNPPPEQHQRAAGAPGGREAVGHGAAPRRGPGGPRRRPDAHTVEWAVPERPPPSRGEPETTPFVGSLLVRAAVKREDQPTSKTGRPLPSSSVQTNYLEGISGHQGQTLR